MEMNRSTSGILKGALTLSCILSLFQAAFSQNPVKIENESLEADVILSCNGKIVSLKEKGGAETVYFKDDGGSFIYGAGKHRTYEEPNYFKDEFKIMKVDKNSIAMKGTHGRIEVSKTISLPPGKKYVKIELAFKDTIPLAEKIEISPWLHNTFLISEVPSENCFYLPHEKGVRMDISETGPSNTLLKSDANWIIYYNKKAVKGMLMASELPPKGVYCWCNPQEKIGTLEFLFPKINPVPEYRITYYLAPISSVDGEGFTATGIPVKPKPALPERGKEFTSTLKESITIGELYQKAPEKRFPFEVQFWQPALVISPDAVYPYSLGVRANKAGKDNLVIIDVPEGMEMVQWCDKYWWAKETARLLKEEDVKRDADNYRRFIFSVNPNCNQTWMGNYLRLFFKTSKTSGTLPRMYYRSGQNGELFPEKSVSVEIVKIPQSKVPKRFVTMMGCDYEMMKKYPDWQKNLKRMGVNGICLNYNVPGEGFASVEEVRDMNRAMKKDGFVTATMGGNFFEPPKDPDLRAIDINGKLTDNFDFTARGPFMDKVAERIELMGGAPEFDILISDYEAYFNGYNLSFTERTLNKFKEYFGKNIKNLEYIDPKTVTLNKRKYPEHYKIWVEWKSREFYEYMNEIAVRVKKKYPNMKIGFCTTPGVSEWQCKEIYLQDNRLWNSTFLDLNVDMLYNNVYGSMYNCHSVMDTMGGMEQGTKATFFPALTFGFWGEVEYKSPPEDSRYIIYEAATSGAKGYWVFPGFTGSNGWHYAEMALANRVIADYEDVFMDGRRMDGIVKKVLAKQKDGETTEIRPKVLVWKNKIILYLAEYSGKNMECEAVMNLPFEYSLKDAETGESLANISNGGTLKFKLGGKVKAKIFILESISGKEFPADFRISEKRIENKDASGGIEAVFYDSFDTEPLKGKSLDKYPMYSSPGGIKNNCLKITDYRGVCIYDENIKINSGNLTVNLCYNPGRTFDIKQQGGFSIFKIMAGKNYQIMLERVSTDGKLRLLARYDNNYLWNCAVFSKITTWNNKWYNIMVSFGDDGAVLRINGELQGENKTKWPSIKEITSIQLGLTWRTFGTYDELKIYDSPIDGVPAENITN